MFWQGARSDRPAGELATIAGALGPKVVDVPLVKVNTAGTTQTSGTVVAKIQNPSRKLGCGFQVHFEVAKNDGRTVASFAGAPANVWTTRVVDPVGGHLMHVLQQDATIPRQYEMETFAPGVLLSITLGLPLDIAAAAIAGTWVMRVRWEPVVPLCDDEIRQLYGLTGAWLERGLSAPLAP